MNVETVKTISLDLRNYKEIPFPKRVKRCKKDILKTIHEIPLKYPEKISLNLQDYREIPVETSRRVSYCHNLTKKELFLEAVENGISHNILLKQFPQQIVQTYYMMAMRKCRPSRKKSLI